MDIRDEMSLSKDDPSAKSSLLRVFDQNKHRNKLLGVKDKPQVGNLSPRKSHTRDMIIAAKHGDKVLNVQPVSEFNPTTGIQVLKPLVKKPLDVWDKVKDKASVKKPTDVVKKPEKVKDKATVKKLADVVEKPVTVVVKDKATVKKPAVVVTVKKPANVVEKPAVLVKENDKAKTQVSIVKENDVVPDVDLEKVVSNDKELSDSVSKKSRRRTELPKLNASADVADKVSDVVNNKDKESVVADKESDVDKDKFGANELLSDVVSKKRRHQTELPKVNVPATMADKPLVEKSVVKAAVKPAVKPAIKGNESKMLKSKSGMKRKMKNSSDSLSSSVDEKELRHLLKKLKNIKQEDFDESVSDRKMKYKKKEKELTPSEAAHEEYLKHYPTLRARAVPKSLFAAIRGSQVDMWCFLSEVGFNSFHNLAIDEIPLRVGRFCVANFNSFTYKLSLDSGDSIHVNPSKIHDILIDFLFNVNFLTLFTNTTGRVFGLKGEICLDLVRCLHEVSDISKIDWCGYIHRFLEDSEILKKQIVQYLGPFLFLILLYFDSTKFDGVPVGRTRPTIRAWNSTLMRQREKLELDAHVLGLLKLYDESTGSGSMVTSEKENLIKKAEEKLSIVCSERVFLEGCLMTASEKYPGMVDDDVIDDDVNEDDYDNVDGNDSFVTDKDVRVEDDGNHVVDGNGDGQDDNGGSKNQVESTEKQSADHTDPNVEEKVLSEENYITCTLPEGDALDAVNLDTVRMEESDAGPVTPERLAIRVSKHSKIQRLKAKILKLKWKTNTNFRDYGIFAMLHMESYSGQTASIWDCGLVSESKLQCDMLRRLRSRSQQRFCYTR
ncbi:hypothetical protein Tco_0522509 [Tanacetum coccineum]